MLEGRPLMNIFDLKQQGLSYREIARETGHSRNTVRKYLRDGASSRPSETKPQRNSKLDPYESEVDRLVSEGLPILSARLSAAHPSNSRDPAFIYGRTPIGRYQLKADGSVLSH